MKSDKILSYGDLSNPESIKEYLEDENTCHQALALVQGAVGAIQKGGNAVTVSQEDMDKAQHYLNVLTGKESRKKDSKFYSELSRLVNLFCNPEKKGNKMASEASMQNAVSNLLRVAHDLMDLSPRASEAIVYNLNVLLQSPNFQVAGRTEDKIQQTVVKALDDSNSSGKSITLLTDQAFEAYDEVNDSKMRGHLEDKLIKTVEKCLGNDKLTADYCSAVINAAFKHLPSSKKKQLESKFIGKDLDPALFEGGLSQSQLESAFAEADSPALVKKPAVASIAQLVHLAYTNPEARPVLIPIIAARMSKKKPTKKAMKKPAKKATSKAKVSKKPVPKKSSKKPVNRRRASVDISLSDSMW